MNDTKLDPGPSLGTIEGKDIVLILKALQAYTNSMEYLATQFARNHGFDIKKNVTGFFTEFQEATELFQRLYKPVKEEQERQSGKRT